jgi:hypothetical protein
MMRHHGSSKKISLPEICPPSTNAALISNLGGQGTCKDVDLARAADVYKQFVSSLSRPLTPARTRASKALEKYIVLRGF